MIRGIGERRTDRGEADGYALTGQNQILNVNKEADVTRADISVGHLVVFNFDATFD